MCASKKGVSAHQLHRMLGITYKSAWFMCHRIREATKRDEMPKLTGVVEADETYMGPKTSGDIRFTTNAYRTKSNKVGVRSRTKSRLTKTRRPC